MSRRSHSRYLYLMESKDLLKIGISFNPYKRLIQLNDHNKDSGQVFNVIKFVDCLNTPLAELREKQMHLKFKEYQILTDLEGAKTECFSKEIKSLVIEELDAQETYHYFDPFITCSYEDCKKFMNANKIDNKILCDMVNKNYSDVNVKALKKALRCILANLTISKGKRVVCIKKDIDNLASSKYFCYKLLDSTFLIDGYLQTGNLMFEVTMVKYDSLASKSLSSNYFKNYARKLFLTGLYSYTECLSENFKNAVDAL